MFRDDQYQLLDYGNHLKLERFSGITVCRETPSAISSTGRGNRSNWPSCDLEFARTPNRTWLGTTPESWQLEFGDTGITFDLRTTPTGQIGVFPEQAINWDWMLNRASELSGCRAINLFGYTGGSTLALARAGCEVVHIDSASSVVNWGRHNATLSNLNDAPIRWIVEDAFKFVRREIKRGNRYDVIVADPPSFGRGKGGETWKLERDLEKFAEALEQLLSPQPKAILFSCHTPSISLKRLTSTFDYSLGDRTGSVDARELELVPARPCLGNQRPLASGCCYRWSTI